MSLGLKYKNEDEYRIVFANDKIQMSNGKAVSYNDLSISANKIFIGANCLERNRKRLEEIAEIRGINYVHM